MDNDILRDLLLDTCVFLAPYATKNEEARKLHSRGLEMLADIKQTQFPALKPAGQDVVKAVLCVSRLMSHLYEWVSYAEIRKRSSKMLFPRGKAGQAQLMKVLRDLVLTGFLKRQGQFWSLSAEYRSYLRTPVPFKVARV